MNNALWMPNLTIESLKETPTRVEFMCSAKSDVTACARCGVIGHLYKHGLDRCRYQDVHAFGKQVFIRVDVQRYRCRSCKATFSQPMPEMDGRRQMTKRCVEYIARRSQSGDVTNSAIAREIGINEKTIRQISGEHFADRMASRKIKAPMLLGIDELTLDGKNRRRTIFVDVGGRKPLDIIDSMTRKAVDRWLYVLPNREQVQVVTMDMWRPYRDSVRAILPQAKIVVDKFHVIAPVGMALDKVRNRARRGGATPRKNPRTGKVLLQTSRHNLTPMRRMLLDGILANSPLISAAWHAKESFYDIWEAGTRSAAEAAYDKWRASIPSDIAPEFNPVVGMINNWREEVFAYFDHPVTNAYTEAANGIIKVANRAGRGYEFANIRAKALLRPAPKTRSCEICKNEYPASSLQKVDVHLPHWDEGEVMVSKMCGNCHYVFHTNWMPYWAPLLAKLSTSESE